MSIMLGFKSALIKLQLVRRHRIFTSEYYPLLIGELISRPHEVSSTHFLRLSSLGLDWDSELPLEKSLILSIEDNRVDDPLELTNAG